MAKADTIRELTNILAVALRHRIGSIVNPDEVYAQKYAKDADILLREAQKVALQEHWNDADKEKIRQELLKKLHAELEKKSFLDVKKFDYISSEIANALQIFGLNK